MKQTNQSRGRESCAPQATFTREGRARADGPGPHAGAPGSGPSRRAAGGTR
ncbi:hypothetical protein GCM10017559_30530 [Streptosporangium longisporum]|uniref:Uncharacterized protein n=1 Tax=Streptosporangium longisporum TaxID=46187 RepID=A0ABN3XXJ8_9ACTN